LLLAAAGCQDVKSPPAPSAGRSDELYVAPLPVQQAKAYPETVTGVFVSLADFEAAPGGKGGQTQVSQFSIRPAGAGGGCKFVVNVTRTGAGAMEVALPPKAKLVFSIPYVHDLTGYTLLSVALHSETLRDDLMVTLATDGASWSSNRALVRPGWNNVLIDIRRLQGTGKFDAKAVREMHLAFADAAGPVTFGLDDVMLVDNRRALADVPPGMTVRKTGLDYELQIPNRSSPVALFQGDDGLWRLGKDQPVIRLVALDQTPSSDREQLELMGSHRLGHVEVLENNALRVRIANTWYFPTRAGEWASLAVRQIRWEHTFYFDSRWVTNVELNDAGGQGIGLVQMRLPEPAAIQGKASLQRDIAGELVGSVRRWAFLIPPPGPSREVFARNYVKPGTLIRKTPPDMVFAPGDVDRDGFDESQGCYYHQAKDGQCRLTIVPPEEGLLSPVIRVGGKWEGPVSASSEGLSVRGVAYLPDGSVLLVLPGKIARRVAVEVTGKFGLLEGN